MRSIHNSNQGLIFAALAASIFSCTQPQMPATTISGRIPGYETKTVRLLQVVPHQRERLLLDSVRIDSTGAFRFGPIPLDSSLVQLDISQGPGWLLFTDSKKIETALVQENAKPTYTVTGSAGSEWILKAYRRITTHETQLELSRNRQLDFSRQNYPDSLQMLATNQYRRDSAGMVFMLDSLLRNAPHVLLYRYTASHAARYMPKPRMDSLHAWAARRFADSTWLP